MHSDNQQPGRNCHNAADFQAAIKIADAFAHLPFTALAEGLDDETLTGWANYIDPEMEPMLAAALALSAEHDWDVFPADISLDEKTGRFRKKSFKSAKRSGGANWGKTRDPEQIRRDFARWPDAGIGLPTGKENRIWVLETDTKAGHANLEKDGETSLRALEQEHGPLPQTLMAESPSGSLHRYFNYPKDLEIRNSTVAPGVDVRGEGGMVIAPPSMRDDGVYRWLNAPIVDAPQWLLDRVTAPARSNGKGANAGKPSAPIEPAEAFKGLDPNQRLAEGLKLPEFPPLPFEPDIKAGCGWLRHVHDSGGADQDQQLWWMALKCCIFLENGEALIHEFSSKYDGYSVEETEKKFEETLRYKEQKDLGYPQCQTICAIQCKTCQYLELNQSPLNLALQQLPNVEAKPEDSKPSVKKLPLIVELGSRLWGAPTLNGKEYRFGADQSKAIDPYKGVWFDFTIPQGGNLRDLIRKVEKLTEREQPNADDVVLVCAADVKMRPLDWLWEGHLLRGSQELMSGPPDLSKSTVQIGQIACVTARLPWPDGAPAIEPMNVIMLTAEDTLDQIVVPRLHAAGADLNRVSFLKCIKKDEHNRQFLLAEDLDRLDRLVKKIGDVGLITIDPITAYMGGKMDSYKATEVRSQLGPLKDFAERTNVALSTITHPSKNAGPTALNHFIGSQAFIAACRVGHLCVAEVEEKDGEHTPTGRILFTNVRNTAHQLMPTLAYCKEVTTVSTEPNPITAPRIKWEGTVDITADAAVAAASGKKQDLQPQVQAFLRELLKDDKPIPQTEIEDVAKAKGFTEKQLRTAREKLGVHVEKEKGKMNGRWFWQMPNPNEGRYHY